MFLSIFLSETYLLTGLSAQQTVRWDEVLRQGWAEGGGSGDEAELVTRT